jgi:hypothetical protein
MRIIDISIDKHPDMAVSSDIDLLPGACHNTCFSAGFSAALLLCATLLSGCAFTVIPPPSPSHPASVFLLDHGRHSSLVLPADQGMIRYSYGDWDWYALNKTGIGQGGRALFRASPAGLGRRKISAAPTEESVRRTVHVPIEHIFSLSAEAQNIARLRARLDKIFVENQGNLHHNPIFGLDFVPHPEPYTISHNSNTVVAQWLRELGFEVRGGGPLSRWKIMENP